MLFQFAVRFSFRGLLYKAEVKAFNFEESVIYDVYYSLNGQFYPVEIVQICRGSGPERPKMYWRQCATTYEAVMIDHGLINTIGNAIELQEDMDFK